jgi:hypothetical protein
MGIPSQGAEIPGKESPVSLRAAHPRFWAGLSDAPPVQRPGEGRNPARRIATPAPHSHSIVLGGLELMS